MRAISATFVCVFFTFLAAGNSTGITPRLNEDAQKSMVAIFETGKPICAGAFISQEFVVSTANCVTEKRNLTVVTDLEKPEETGKNTFVKMVIIHPYYSRNFDDYNVAVLKVKPLENRMETLKLASVEPEAGQTVLITGWGAKEEKIFASDNTTVVNRGDCKKQLMKEVDLTRKSLCLETGNGSLPFVEGSPTMDGNSQVLYGIASRRFNRSESSLPDLYVNIVHAEIRNFLAMFETSQD